MKVILQIVFYIAYLYSIAGIYQFNIKKEFRYKQWPMPIIALIYGSIVSFLVKYGITCLEEYVNQGIFQTLSSKLLIIYFILAVYGYYLLKRLVITLCKKNQPVSWIYSYNEKNECFISGKNISIRLYFTILNFINILYTGIILSYSTSNNHILLPITSFLVLSELYNLWSVRDLETIHTSQNQVNHLHNNLTFDFEGYVDLIKKHFKDRLHEH